jgi:flagellar biosynthesis protein FlhA
VIELAADPRLIEEFATEASAAIRKFTEKGTNVVLAVTPEARPYVRMILERVFPTLPILSHVEVARSAEIRPLGAIS